MRYKRGITNTTGEHLNHGTEKECRAGCLIHSTPFLEQKFQLHEKGILTKELLVYYCPQCEQTSSGRDNHDQISDRGR
jgi:hypothetical protein